MRSVRTSTDVYRTYFRDRVHRFGGNLATLDYGSRASQALKFKILHEGIRAPKRPFSLLDLGCGFGDFLAYLRRRRAPLRRYHGVDLVPEIVGIAQRRHPGERFEVRDILRQPLRGSYDYGVANGIFYLRAVDSRKHLERTVRAMWARCREGVLFNARSQYADPEFVQREHHLFQYHPLEVLRFCMTLSRAVVLRHDYMPHEFTVYMYRDVAK